jgi:hypothetical protein
VRDRSMKSTVESWSFEHVGREMYTRRAKIKFRLS